jgi:hypothetical protein
MPTPNSMSMCKLATYRWVGVCLAGLGGAGGSVGDSRICGGSSPRLHSLVAISVFMLRNFMHSACVVSQSRAPCPRSKHQGFDGDAGSLACAMIMAIAGNRGHIGLCFLSLILHDRKTQGVVKSRSDTEVIASTNWPSSIV